MLFCKKCNLKIESENLDSCPNCGSNELQKKECSYNIIEEEINIVEYEREEGYN